MLLKRPPLFLWLIYLCHRRVLQSTLVGKVQFLQSLISVSHTHTHTQYATVLCSSFFFFTAIHHTKELRVNVSLALFPLVTAAHEVEKESRSVSLCRIIGDNNVLYHNSLQQIHHRRRVEI